MNVIVLNAWQLFFKGGPMMWPIFILSILAVGIGINRIMFLISLERRLIQEKVAIIESLHQGRLKETMRLCENLSGPVARMAKAGIVRFGASIELLKGVMAEEADYQAQKLMQFLGVLSIIVNVAPLLGLLGTVNSMAVVFHAVQIRSNALSPLTAGELASGIWQALLTTSSGLIVGIISYVIYSLCAMRINKIIVYMNHANIEMANILQQLSESVKVSYEQDNRS